MRLPRGSARSSSGTGRRRWPIPPAHSMGPTNRSATGSSTTWEAPTPPASGGSNGPGGKLEGYYFVVGEDEIVELIEMPDDVSMEAITMAVLASGAVRSVQTSTLLTAEEAMEAMRRAGSLGYRPPE